MNLRRATRVAPASCRLSRGRVALGAAGAGGSGARRRRAAPSARAPCPGAHVALGARPQPADASQNATQNPKAAVTAAEELKRVLPVIAELKKRQPTVVVSVNTYKAGVARAATSAGAEIVNDVSGFRWDPQMAKTVAELKCGAILMHMRGRPEEWRTLPPPVDVVLLVKRELKQWAEAAIVSGVRRERIAIDPGFGFGKSFDENYPLLSR